MNTTMKSCAMAVLLAFGLPVSDAIAEEPFALTEAQLDEITAGLDPGPRPPFTCSPGATCEQNNCSSAGGDCSSSSSVGSGTDGVDVVIDISKSYTVTRRFEYNGRVFEFNFTRPVIPQPPY
jgi:hypothetical protein